MISNSGWAAPYGTYHRGYSTACSVCTMKVIFLFQSQPPSVFTETHRYKDGV